MLAKYIRINEEVRKAIEEIGGTMPEDLPTPKKSVKEIESKPKRNLIK